MNAITKAHETTFAKLADGSMNTLGIFLLQEIDKFNALVGGVKSMLNELQRGLKGLVVMSASLDAAYANLLFQMALLNSGFLIESPVDLTEPLEKLIKVGFGLSRDEPVEEIEVSLEDDQDEEEEAQEEEEEEEEEEAHLGDEGLEEEEMMEEL